MSNARDFIVTVHALERFQERFPALWTNDREVGRLIHGETMAALKEGRFSYVPPLELASYSVSAWAPGSSTFVWTPDRMRGYVLVEDEQGEQTIATVLVGEPLDEARKKLWGNRSWRIREERDGSHDEADASQTSLETPPAPHPDERERASCADGG